MSPLTSSQGIIHFGDFDVDLHSGELRKHGLRIKLQVQPFQVLQILLEHHGEVVTRKELQRRIWAADTFVDFDHGLNNAVKKLREALADDAEKPRFIETLSKRGYRFIAPLANGNGRASSVEPATPSLRQVWKTALLIVAVLGGAALGAGLFWHAPHARMLTEKDTIVLGDFANSTGDSVFDGTLREGLSVQLQQSPFLSLLSEEGIRQTLRMMGQPTNARLGPEITRELCQRTNSMAALNGSIALIGTRYDLILKAVNCVNGHLLASTEAQANDTSHVLDSLSKVASEMRTKLGESLSTVQEYSASLEQATTPSLEALQAYSLGRKQVYRGAAADAVPLLKRATELDPNFGLAYAGLSLLYSGEDSGMSAQYAMKAFELRNHVSEREKLYISAVYYRNVTGELDKTIETLEVMEQTYPRDTWAHGHLAGDYERAGELAEAAQEYRTLISLEPQRLEPRHNLGAVLLRLGRLDEAKAIFEELIAKNAGNINVHVSLYRIAYAQKDVAGMQRELEWAVGKPDEFRMIEEQSERDLGEGKLERAGELLRRANDLAAGRNLNRETAWGTARLAAYRALLGDCQGLREHVASAEVASPELRWRFATPLALCGYTRQTQGLIEDARTHFPKDTLIQAVQIPLASAAIAIHNGNSVAAVKSLQPAAPYENGYPGPIYLRGLAYLQASRLTEAATEFQKIVRRTDVFTAEPIQALAHVQLGRAYALQGDKSKARAAYQDFFTLWKNADPDIPILKQAKFEYAKLQ